MSVSFLYEYGGEDLGYELVEGMGSVRAKASVRLGFGMSVRVEGKAIETVSVTRTA